MKTILVTGGSGLIGTALKSYVENKIEEDTTWIFVSSSDGDLRFKDQTEALFRKHKPTHVFHLAAMVGGLFHNIDHNLDYLRNNMSINQNVLEACHEFGVKKVISCLSTCILPDKIQYPIDETMANKMETPILDRVVIAILFQLHKGPPHYSNFGYSYAKRSIDIFNRAYNQGYGSVFTSVMFSNAFGPNDNFDLRTCHMIPGVIRRISDAIHRGDKSVTICGSGKPVRQCTYSKDIPELLIWAMNNYDSVEPIMLLDETEFSIADIVESIKRAFNYECDVIFDTSKPDGQFRKTATAKKMQRLLPNFKFTNFDDAIKETVQWFIKNENKARR